MTRSFILATILLYAAAMMAQKVKLVTARNGVSIKLISRERPYDDNDVALNTTGNWETIQVKRPILTREDTIFIGIDSGYAKLKYSENLVLLQHDKYRDRTELLNLERTKNKKRVIFTVFDKKPFRMKEDVYLKVDKISFNVPPKHFTQRHYEGYPEYLKNDFDNIYTSPDDIEVERSAYRRGVNRHLASLGYNDTMNTVLVNTYNFIHADYEVVSLTEHKFHPFCVVEMKVVVTFPEFFGANKVKTYKVRSRIGYDESGQNETKNYSLMADALQNVSIEYLNDTTLDGYLHNLANKLGGENEAQPVLSISTGTNLAENLEDATQAVVTLVQKDGHGSGCIISGNGYIVTNYHVAGSQTSDLFVVFNNGARKPATFIRGNAAYDLTLLKVDTVIAKPLSISKDPVNVGSEVYAIGTPNDVSLGQTVTRGIISSKRSIEGRQFLQSDASVNKGNSGGALVNKDGKLIGIVTSKLIGYGVEGVSFAIPSQSIAEYLRLTITN